MASAGILHSVEAQRGDVLRCKGWKQETILRILENSVENTEYLESLVIYGGNDRCARNWESYCVIVKLLKKLEDDGILVIQSGVSMAIFKTHRLALHVVVVTTNIMKATWEVFYELQSKNLIIFAQYTMTPWEYVGTQGAIKGTFKTLSIIAGKVFGGDLTGRVYLMASTGDIGGSQAQAMETHGGVCTNCDVDRRIVERRIGKDYCDIMVETLDEAIEMVKKAYAEEKPLSISVPINVVDTYEAVLQRKDGRLPDICSEVCSCHDPPSYISVGHDMPTVEAMRVSEYDRYMYEARESMERHLCVTTEMKKRGAEVFEYGASIRKGCMGADMSPGEAKQIGGFVAAYFRPLFNHGRGPFRWTCISGEVLDLACLDDLALEVCKGDRLVKCRISLAHRDLPIGGLPAHVCCVGFGQRKRFALAVNELIKEGEIKGPVAFSHGSLDSGPAMNPTSGSENMPDGDNLISSWPYLNGLLNASGMCDLIAIQVNYSMGEIVHTGVTQIVNGADEAAFRLGIIMSVDSDIGVVRHAQVGYQIAKDVHNGKGNSTDESIKIPLWWEPTDKVIFGPEGRSVR